MSELSGVNVLFVEDSADDVELALRSLKADGITPQWRRVERESDLRQALGNGPKPNAILSDFSMPGFDGLHALRIARELTPEIPFIFVSGTIGEERAIEAIRAGATDYVLKNNLRRLGTAVKRALAESADRQRTRQIEDERARLVEILEATSDYVAMASPEGEVLYLNAAWRSLAAIQKEGPPDRQMGALRPPWVTELMHSEALLASARDGVWQGETAVLAADGTEVPVSQVLIAHRGADGEIRFRSTIARDIRERKAYEARLKYLANYDSLTALPNRSLLADRTSQAIAHAKRIGRACAMLVVNVDRFKLLNDSYGHAAGDSLLKLIGERLSQTVRGGDTAARVGADVFAVLAGDVLRPDDVLRIARNIRRAMTAPFAVDGREIHVTLSVGASMHPRDGEDFDLLLRNADAAANRVKDAGGNAFQFYAADMTRQALDRVELENALRSEVEQRTALEGRVAALGAEIDALHGDSASNAAGSRAADAASQDAAQGAAAIEGGPPGFARRFRGPATTEQRVEQLVSAGFAPDRAAWIEKRTAELQMQAIQAQYSARRGDTVDPTLLRGEQTLRQDLGDAEYERYLTALGRPTKVGVFNVIASSPAEQAGLHAGDQIVSYGGARVFDMRELNDLTLQGTPGQPVAVEVERDGQNVQLVLPRGPIGIGGGPFAGGRPGGR